MDSSADAIGMVDAKGRFVRWNKASEEIYGYSKAEIKEKHFSELYAYPPELEIMLAKLRRDGFIRKYEISMKKKDGNIAPFNLSINLLYDRQKNLTGSLCIARDRSDTRRTMAELQLLNERLQNEISERKRNEESLRESETRLSKAEQVANLGHWELDLKSQKLSWSKEVYCLFAKDPDTFVPTFDGFLDSIHPKDRSSFMQLRSKALAEGREFTTDYRIIMPDGSLRFMQEKVEFTKNGGDANPTRIFGTIQDITERKQMEEVLRNNEQFLTDIFNSIQDGLSILDPDLNMIRVNPAMEKFGNQFGYPQPMVGRKCYEVFHRRNAPCEVCPAKQAFLKGEPCHIIVKRVAVDGSERFIEISAFPQKDHSSRQVQTVIEYVRDVTQTKQAEEALRQSEEKFRLVFERAPIGTQLYDQKGTITDCNEKFEEIIGAPKEKFIGLNLVRQLRNRNEQVQEAVAASLRGEVGYYEGEFCSVTSGKTSIIRAIYQPIFSAEGAVSSGVAIFEDIAERQKAEEERLQFSKLESMSILAGGIAHDFNNILTTILGNIGLAMFNKKLDEQEIDSLTQAENACFRAKDLSTQLLTFAKGGAPIKKVASLTKLVRESAKLALAGSKSLCEFSFPENLWSVEIDQGQINQVINNLLINADQAMPSGRIIRIEAENIVFKRRADLPLPEGKYVKLTITDQGIGIPKEYLAKIFDPYFTTKQKGSGLGLATAYSIIKKHSGRIKVNSQLGVGTTFKIYLPAKVKKPAVSLDEPDTFTIGQGKVLVMDDDENIRELLCGMLGHLGYEADSASNGSQAIEKFIRAKESGQTFDAVILDLTVPGGMGGKETMERLLEIDPQVKAIVSSGYSDDPIMADFEQYGFSGVIAKPYRVVELSIILQGVISKRADEK